MDVLNQILDALHIEIPQLITHIIGFLVLLWILKRYAWKPLLALLDERKEKIKSSFDEIDRKTADADQLRAQYESKLKEIDDEARKRMNAAIAEGEKIAGQIKEEARGEARRIMDRQKAELDQDYAKARVQLKEDVIAMTMTATERIIKESLDEAKHRDLISRFIDEVEEVK
jgi:F-type H+-transporting ATPase subunit b